MQFIRRVKQAREPARSSNSPVPQAKRFCDAIPPTNVRTNFAIQPLIRGLAAVRGEVACTNEDLIRNAAYNWSPMSARDITNKTGIDHTDGMIAWTAPRVMPSKS